MSLIAAIDQAQTRASRLYIAFLIAAAPRAIITRLIAETVKALRDPLVVQRLSSQGAVKAANMKAG